jgi:hypothetical protein
MQWWEIPLYIGSLWLSWKLITILIEVIKSCWK